MDRTRDRAFIRKQAIEWTEDGQNELIFCCSFMIGYHGVITEEMWDVLTGLASEGILKW